MMNQNVLLSQLRLLILVNWQEEGKWSFLPFLTSRVQDVDILQPLSFKHWLNSRLKRASNYLSEFYLPLRALFKKSRHDVIISWQMRIGICYGILKRVFHARKPPKHIIQDFHIDLTQTGLLYRVQIALLKLALPGIDYFFCTSREEEEIYSERFGISRNRIAFLPLMAPFSYLKEPDHHKKDYIFSYGSSDRDFDILIRAVTRLNIKTYILSGKYQSRLPLPAHVSIIRDRISEKELIRWIASSRMVVLPLNDYRISAGQISMLEVMSLGRPLVITANMATKEYAVHQQTGLFFEAGNDRQLADHIQYLWEHREAAERIGQQARRAAWKLGDRRMAVFSNFLESCALDIQKGECL